MLEFDKNNSLRTLIFKVFSQAFTLAGVLIFFYLIFFPFFPRVKYYLSRPGPEKQSLSFTLETVQENKLKKSEQDDKKNKPKEGVLKEKNRIVIPLINVNSPLIEGNDSVSPLSRGAWLLPQGSRPGEGGNTIITAHRFKYLPPHNLTFYLLDELNPGNRIIIYCDKKKYIYKVEKSFVVEADNLSILAPASEEKLTLFTCHPLFSDKQRLVVVARPISG